MTLGAARACEISDGRAAHKVRLELHVVDIEDRDHVLVVITGCADFSREQKLALTAKHELEGLEDARELGRELSNVFDVERANHQVLLVDRDEITAHEAAIDARFDCEHLYSAWTLTNERLLKDHMPLRVEHSDTGVRVGNQVAPHVSQMVVLILTLRQLLLPLDHLRIRIEKRE